MKFIILLLSVILICSSGCSVQSLREEAVCTGMASSDYQMKLTNNTYPDVNPKVARDVLGRAAIFWLSIKMRTPVIKGRFYIDGSWTKERDLGLCVGHWDVSASPKGGFLLARSHWGELHLEYLNLDKIWTWSKRPGLAGRIALCTSSNRSYLVWSERSNGRYRVRGAFGAFNDFRGPLTVAEFNAPIASLHLLPLVDHLLLFVTVRQSPGTALWVQPLDLSLHPIGNSERAFVFQTDNPRVSVTSDAEGRAWLVWQDKVGGIGIIYVSSSSDGLAWSFPERISPIGINCAQPAIVGDERVFVVWTEGDTQLLRGAFWSPSTLQWESLSFLKKSDMKGQGASLAVEDGKLWLTWERKEEIYVAMFSITQD